MTPSFAQKRAPARPSLKDTLVDIDKDILKLLARRANMLSRLHNDKGHLEPPIEKFLRTAWEQNAGRMSRDARLIRQLFALLQEIDFLPRPIAGGADEEYRTAFALAPLRKPVDVRMTAPLACRRSRLYLALAGASGSACDIGPSLLNDTQTECIKMFNQVGAALLWDEGDVLHAREGGGLTLVDKVIFVGDDALNFYLMLGQYVGWHSRAKFTGESNLKLADLTPLRHFLPQLGARMSNAVPGSDGLPIRLECSGMTPEAVRIPADLPADAVTGLLMAAPFWEKPIAIDLSDHPDAQAILEEAVSILRDCQAKISVQDAFVRLEPCQVRVPRQPALGMDLTLAAYLLALPALTRGTVLLEGRWPQCAVADSIRVLLEGAGAQCTVDTRGIVSQVQIQEGASTIPANITTLPAHFAPLAIAIATVRALDSAAPVPLPAMPADIDTPTMESFFTSMGLAIQNDILARVTQPLDTAWAAPSAPWAMALALAAYGRRGLKLANPGIVTNLYPAFWNLYNSLPCPERKKLNAPLPDRATEDSPPTHKPVRRRIVAEK